MSMLGGPHYPPKVGVPNAFPPKDGSGSNVLPTADETGLTKLVAVSS